MLHGNGVVVLLPTGQNDQTGSDQLQGHGQATSWWLNDTLCMSFGSFVLIACTCSSLVFYFVDIVCKAGSFLNGFSPWKVLLQDLVPF